MTQGQIEITDIHWLMDILQNIDVGLVVLDRDYRIHLWNGFMESHSGISPQKAKDQILFSLFDEIPEAWFRQKAEPVFQLRTRTFTIWEQRPFLFRFYNSRPITGQSELMFQNTTIIPLESLDRTVNHICLIVYDVTDTAISRGEVSKANESLSAVTSRDSLTGLLNRDSWLPTLDHAIAEHRNHQQSSALLVVDLDHFRDVNRVLGHVRSDEILKRIATALSTLAQENCTARIGGELFALLLKNTESEQAIATAERLRRGIAGLTKSAGTDISASVGVAMSHDALTDAQDWLNCADKALYHAKESGKNKTTLYQYKTQE